MCSIYDNDAAFFDFLKVTPDNTIVIYVDTSKMRVGDLRNLIDVCRQTFPKNEILVLPDVSRIESVDTDELIHIRESIDAMIKERVSDEQRTA